MVIRTNCPCCGDVSVRPSDIRLEHSGEGTRGRYAFACPVCGRSAVGFADTAALAMLRSAGVICVIELRPDPSLPPLTYDDLLDFCTEDLESDLVVATMQQLLGSADHPSEAGLPGRLRPGASD